jgi:hypothetical protein
MYDEDGIFCINVLHRSKWQIESGAKRRDRAFYFEKERLIGAKGNDGSDDVEFLLGEAARYLEQGTAYLKEL